MKGRQPLAAVMISLKEKANCVEGFEMCKSAGGVGTDVCCKATEKKSFSLINRVYLIYIFKYSGFVYFLKLF